MKGVNKWKKTPSHPKKKGVVLAKEGDKVKLIRFGDQNMGHNYSPEARELPTHSKLMSGLSLPLCKSFKARHASNIKKGKMSAAYWADKAFWAGPKGDKKQPPKK